MPSEFATVHLDVPSKDTSCSFKEDRFTLADDVEPLFRSVSVAVSVSPERTKAEAPENSFSIGTTFGAHSRVPGVEP